MPAARQMVRGARGGPGGRLRSRRKGPRRHLGRGCGATRWRASYGGQGHDAAFAQKESPAYLVHRHRRMIHPIGPAAWARRTAWCHLPVQSQFQLPSTRPQHTLHSNALVAFGSATAFRVNCNKRNTARSLRSAVGALRSGRCGVALQQAHVATAVADVIGISHLLQMYIVISH